jgi:molybdopterin synthase catalytic subunit
MDVDLQFTDVPIVIPPRLETLETGACVEFHGIVRQTERGAAIAGLRYEAYVPMAELRIRAILDQLAQTWPCQAVWFVHRIGWVPVGDASLYIRVHSSHREAAFRLAMELVDLLKKDVPIWKAVSEN